MKKLVGPMRQQARDDIAARKLAKEAERKKARARRKQNVKRLIAGRKR